MLKSGRVLLAVYLLIAVALASAVIGQTNERGIDPNNFDNTCAPCSDFYQYVNGNWLKNNPVPAEYGSWGSSHEVFERNNSLVREILEETALKTDVEPGSIYQKIGDFYAVAMDTVKIETEGASPLADDLARINAISNAREFHDILTQYHNEGMSFLFNVETDQDLKDNTQIIVYASQGGLGLPDRDYYTREDEESVTLRNRYVEHITNMFKLLGDDDAFANAQAMTILSMETRLANASLTNVELRDPAGWYNPLTVAGADQQTPSFSWSKYFADLKLPDVKSFSYVHPKFFAEMNLMLQEMPIENWKSYLRWHLINRSAPFLSSPFVNENFQFYSATLMGTKELRPRWKRVVRVIDAFLGEAMGQLYVERAFPPQSKTRALEMVNNLLASLKDRLTALEWMTPETKEKALNKLSTFSVKIGYPDKWRDYSALEINRDSYIKNVRKGRAFEIRRNFNKIGKPVDKTEWPMNPQEVNAGYNPLRNEIIFPAGILQPPFFDGQIDDAVNYGAIGATIGHEITHGFDDKGSLFDADGNLNNWWSENDLTEFVGRTKKIIDQFNGYIVIDSLHINGELTVGENIADLGGLLISYNALQKALEGKSRDKIDGFTPEQRFFLSFAQAWRGNDRDEFLKLIVNSDVHSPNKFRVLGPLSNMEEFRKAFECKEGDAMVRPDSLMVKIW